MENEAWFYPNVERKEAELKCRNTGDYLVRYSSKQNRYILTVNWAGQGRHFIIQEQYNVGASYICIYLYHACCVCVCVLIKCMPYGQNLYFASFNTGLPGKNAEYN